MKRLTLKWLPGVVVVLALSGCVGAPQVPADRYHRIDMSDKAMAGSLPLISVHPYEARGIYAERALLYVDSKTGAAAQQYRYDFWAEPPVQMLEDALVQYLRGVAGAERVFTRTSRVETEVLIRPRLRLMEHRVQAGAGEAHLALEFAVLDAKQEPLFVMDFDRTEPCSAQGPDAYVAAVGRLAGKAHAELLARLRTGQP